MDLSSHRVLLMGDAQAGSRGHWNSGVPTPSSTEGLLLACCINQLHADVLVVGHHGSLMSSRRTFLDAVHASTYIISSGPHKYHGVTLPDPEVVTALQARGSVFRTDQDDAACATTSHKIGPDADGEPGGCDNVHVQIGNTIKTEYWHLSD